MLPSLRLARNTLAGKPGRTALMAGAVALASGLVVAVSCAIGSVQKSLELGLTRLLGAADARVIHPANGHFSDDVLNQVRAWPEVQHATGRLFASLTLAHADQRRDARTAEVLRVTPMALGIEFENESHFRTVELISGEWPAASNEVLLDPMTVEQLQASIGDVLQVQRSGEPLRLIVAGIYERPKLGAVQRPMIQLDRRTLAEAADQQGQLTSIAVILRDGADVGAFCARRAAALPNPVTLEPAEMVRTGFDRQIIASHFGFVVASVLTFMRRFVHHRDGAHDVRDRAAARNGSDSMHRREPQQIFASQLLVGAIMAAVGTMIGIPLGIGLTGVLVWHFHDLLPAGLHVHPLGIQLALIGAVVAGVAGALYPAWMASRVSPLQAMTYMGRPVKRSSIVYAAAVGLMLVALQLVLMLPATADARFFAYAYVGLPVVHIGYFILAVPMVVIVSSLTAPALSATMRLPPGMLARSVLATPFRHGFTAGALMVGISILVSTWSSMMSIQHDWLGKIRFADGFAYRITGIKPHEQRAIAQLPFVEETCPIVLMPLRVIDRQIFGVQGLSPPMVNCFGFDPEAFFAMNAVEWVAGSADTALPRLLDGSGIIVADRFLTTQRVKLGDRLKLGAGRVGKEFEIVGAVSSGGLDLATQAFGIRNQYMEFSVSSVFMDFNTVSRVFDNRDAHMLQVNFDKSIDDKQIIQAIAEAAPGVQFNSGRWILKTVNEVAATLLTVQSAIAFAALFLACLGVGNVILANIHGRRYEYGVLRAVGAQRRTLAKLILGEAAILALTGALTGTILGLHMAWVGASHYRDLAGLPVRLSIPEIPAAIGWLVLLIMTTAASVPGIISVVRRQPSALLAAGRNG